MLGIQQNGNVAELRSLETRDTFHQTVPKFSNSIAKAAQGSTNDEPNLKPKGSVTYHFIVNRSLDSEN